MAILLKVSAQESGLKLFAFLRRCLINEDAELYRWIRTGQVRINSARAKSVSRVCEGDNVRLPPFAQSVHPIENFVIKEQYIKEQCINEKDLDKKYVDTKDFSIKVEQKATIQKNAHFDIKKQKNTDYLKNFELVPIRFTSKNSTILIPRVYENEHLLIINKPAGLASQGGTKQSVNLVEILKQSYKNARFIPAPAHRLDKMTSGLLCIGKSYNALRYLSEFLQEKQNNSKNIIQEKLKNSVENPQENICKKLANKEYLAWVHTKDLLLGHSFMMEHYLYFDEITGKMCAQAVNKNGDLNKDFQGKYALSQVLCLAKRGDYSLIKVGIFTGRKHQIRVQCEALGFPIVGDTKYCMNKYGVGMLDKRNSVYTELKLHSYRLILPENKDLYHENVFEIFPPWVGEFFVNGDDLNN